MARKIISKTNLFETWFLKEVLEKGVDLQFKKTYSSCCTRPTNMSGESNRHIGGISITGCRTPQGPETG